MTKTVTLPRESNLARVRSVFSRSVRKAGAACRRHREAPNVGTLTNRRDRVLAARAQSYRVAFVRAYLRTDLRGAARTAHVRKAARVYRDALLRWAGNYDKANGWDAERRTVRRFPEA